MGSQPEKGGYGRRWRRVVSRPRLAWAVAVDSGITTTERQASTRLKSSYETTITLVAGAGWPPASVVEGDPVNPRPRLIRSIVPVWRAKENLLQTAPGIGPVVSRTLFADLPELGRPNRK